MDNICLNFISMIFFTSWTVVIVNKAILCGLSMGGYVALRMAERQPERILGLVLCDVHRQ